MTGSPSLGAVPISSWRAHGAIGAGPDLRRGLRAACRAVARCAGRVVRATLLGTSALCLPGGCGWSSATQRAAAVSAGAFGYGIVQAAYRCPEGRIECRDSAITGAVIAGGLALIAGATAWLEQTQPTAAPAQAVPPVNSRAPVPLQATFTE